MSETYIGGLRLKDATAKYENSLLRCRLKVSAHHEARHGLNSLV